MAKHPGRHEEEIKSIRVSLIGRVGPASRRILPIAQQGCVARVGAQRIVDGIDVEMKHHGFALLDCLLYQSKPLSISPRPEYIAAKANHGTYAF